MAFLGSVGSAIRSQPFIAISAFAALVNSTWSVSTLFHGTEPTSFSLEWFGWIFVGLGFAIAIDVGQIYMAEELRNGERTRPKYIAFGVLALLSYYLQWVYLIAHVPHINLGAGVSAEFVSAVAFFRDWAIWIFPAFLPISTILYTSSFGKARRSTNRFTAERHEKVTIETPGKSIPSQPFQPAPLDVPDQPKLMPGETAHETALRLLVEQPDLMIVSLSKLEKAYPGISRSTWGRAKTEVKNRYEQ